MIEPQHQARPLRRAAMHMRENAQRAMIALHMGQRALDKVETRPPHQRAITEHPEIAVAPLVFVFLPHQIVASPLVSGRRIRRADAKDIPAAMLSNALKAIVSP